MAIYEAEHPLGQDIEKIHGALLAGMANRQDLFSGNAILTFEDALSSGNGVSTLRMANWVTKNQMIIYFPIAVDSDSPEWITESENGLEPIVQRILIIDMLARGFQPRFGDSWKRTPFLKFDVVKEGVVMSIKNGDDNDSFYGGYESEAYTRFSETAMTHGSLSELVILADAV